MEIEFKEPWVPVREFGMNLVLELEREVVAHHPLWKRTFRAVAQRADSDDVLFAVEEAGRHTEYVVVHLTWRGETEVRWPQFERYRSLEEWVRNRMGPDHLAFTQAR